MYVLFKLPNISNPPELTGHICNEILFELSKWAKHYNVEYTASRDGLSVCLRWDDPKDMSIFLLTWTGYKYYIVEE